MNLCVEWKFKVRRIGNPDLSSGSIHLGHTQIAGLKIFLVLLCFVLEIPFRGGPAVKVDGAYPRGKVRCQAYSEHRVIRMLRFQLFDGGIHKGQHFFLVKGRVKIRVHDCVLPSFCQSSFGYPILSRPALIFSHSLRLGFNAMTSSFVTGTPSASWRTVSKGRSAG